VEYEGSNNTVDMARFAMEKLEEGPKDSNNVAVLPEGTRFNSVSVADGLARVDFSKQFINASGVDEIMARFSVVSTLCDIPGIEKVLITVGGEALTSSSTGEEVGVLSKNDIVYDTDMIPANSSEKTTLKLYFANSDATALKAEERQVETRNSLSMEKTIITELLKGPVSKELVAVIPSETKLLNLETNNGVCFVNFSSEFVTKFTGGTNTGMLIVYSIVNSLTELDDVDSVQILIEGKTGVEFGDFVFDEPIERSKNIVQKD
jgi:germination protein M